MINELIFLGYVVVICSALLHALRLGKEYSIALTAVMTVLVNLFVLKQITLGGLIATASDALAVGITLNLNLIQEYYHKETALKTIWVSFFCAFFYIIVSYLHLAYIPASQDLNDAAFQQLLSVMPRIVIASLITFLMVQYIDTYLYARLKKRFQHRFFVLRNYSTLFISQFLDTVLFTFLGLYQIDQGFRSLQSLGEIIVVSFTIKVAVIALSVPFVRLASLLRSVKR